MIQLPEEFDSIFRYIVVVSQRAEQIINGAKPRTESRHAKPTLKARDDVEGGLVEWRVLTQEELDAQRQAMVDQFRAEVDAAGEEVAPRPIPDVLPTAATGAEAAPLGPGDEERDEELDRLQRLLGMVRGTDASAVAEEGVEAKEDLSVNLEDDSEEKAAKPKEKAAKPKEKA